MPRSLRRSGPVRSCTAPGATSTTSPCRVASRRSGTTRSSFSPTRPSGLADPRSLTPRLPSHSPLASRLRLTGRDANDPDRRRRGQHRRARAGDARGRADPGRGGARRRDGPRSRRDPPARLGPPRREPARHERSGGLRPAPARPALGLDEDRDADGGGAGRRRHARAGRRRGSLSDEALLAGETARADRDAPPVHHRMAARLVPVAFPSGDDLTAAYRRLSAAYQQALCYAEDVKRLYQQLQRAIYQSLLGLANALEAKDAYTRGHSERVGAASRSVAVALGLPPHEAGIVGQAGLLHDIGKIGVPEAVLRKHGELDDTEWALMRKHPLIGAQIVSPFEFFAAGALTIRHHHERLDGSGYPDGLAGEAIPVGARIVAVADVYDALTSDRPYRAALPREAALEYLARQAGRTLDGRVVAVFVCLIQTLSTANPDV